jgi:hypothetical protein
MGLDCPSVKFLCAAKSMGIDFTRTMMVGRQLFYAQRATIERVRSVLGITGDPAILLPTNTFGEPFFKMLGADTVSSIDASPYEGATHIHDMNLPLAPELLRRFSVVHDGGSLEHIFNLPQALKNCMEMVELGGHFTQVTVCNNFMGHGFWQISPEALYRTFSKENGFRVKAMLLHEVIPNGRWYTVQDPAEAGRRVELCNSAPTYIMMIAERIELRDIFERPPQQSDYAVAWNRSDEFQSEPNPPFRLPIGVVISGLRLLQKALGRWRFLRKALRRKPLPFQESYYREVLETELQRNVPPIVSHHAAS